MRQTMWRIERERRVSVFEEAPGLGLGPCERERRVNAYEEASGFRLGPRDVTKGIRLALKCGSCAARRRGSAS